MRHRIDGNPLGRDSTHRKATVRDIAKATLTHEQIRTTKAKAKEARRLVEKLITLGKRNTLSAKRKAFSILCDHSVVSNLFKNIAVRFQSRKGGYTRVLALSERRGDKAQLVILELTDKAVVETPKVKAGSKKAKESPEKAAQKQEERERVKKQLAEPKKEHAPKHDLSAPPIKEKPTSDKSKPKSFTGGGIKRFFTKKPSSS